MKTFKEVYKLPFVEEHSWAYDQDGNFCFQFENFNDDVNEKLLDVINGTKTFENPELIFTHDYGEIRDEKGRHFITIRGWGNLTSPNCLDFSPEEAANIQDTLADHIVEQLNKRELTTQSNNELRNIKP